MRHFQKALVLLTLVSLGGCATLPSGPSVNVLPAPGKPLDTFQREDAHCRQWAVEQVGVTPQQIHDRNLATGAVAGTAVGTGVGAVIGSVSGHAGAGALIGAASGFLLGSAIGSDSGGISAQDAQRRYDNAYIQCMYSYGNQIPGSTMAAASRTAAVSPPPLPPEAVAAPQVPEGLQFDEAPRFIYVPEIAMYVAVGLPYDLVYTGNEYYYLHGGQWYYSPYFSGPWNYLTGRDYPPLLRRNPIEAIRTYRDNEYRRYERDREHFDGRFHQPPFQGERRR